MDKERFQANKEYIRRNIEINPGWIEVLFSSIDNHVGKLESTLHQAERDSDLLKIRYLIGMLDGVYSTLQLVEGIRLREEANKKPKSPTLAGSLLSSLGFKR